MHIKCVILFFLSSFATMHCQYKWHWSMLGSEIIFVSINLFLQPSMHIAWFPLEKFIKFSNKS